MADPQLRLENHTAHVKYLALGNGQTITIPPTEDGQPGVGVAFDNDIEQKAFDRALESQIVKTWIDAGDLVVNRGGLSGAINTATSAVQGVVGKATGGKASKE